MKYCEICRSIIFLFTIIIIINIAKSTKLLQKVKIWKCMCYKVWKQYEVIHEIVAKVWNIIKYESVKKSMKIETKRWNAKVLWNYLWQC